MSSGFERAGFETLGAIDNDPKATAVLKANFPNVEHLICADLTELNPAEFQRRTGITQVDVVIGGPPCQGYSVVRQRDGANNGDRLIHDDRRMLYQEFLSFVEHFNPALFLMENVPGMRSAEGGRHYRDMLRMSYEIGYEVDDLLLQASEFSIPQSRRRLFFFGSRTDHTNTLKEIISGLRSSVDLRRRLLCGKRLGTCHRWLPETEMTLRRLTRRYGNTIMRLSG